MQELYGNAVAGQVTSALSRLFTGFLQHAGFTCGIDDLLLQPAAETARKAASAGAEGAALSASASFLGLGPLDDNSGPAVSRTV